MINYKPQAQSNTANLFLRFHKGVDMYKLLAKVLPSLVLDKQIQGTKKQTKPVQGINLDLYVR